MPYTIISGHTSDIQYLYIPNWYIQSNCGHAHQGVTVEWLIDSTEENSEIVSLKLIRDTFF